MKFFILAFLFLSAFALPTSPEFDNVVDFLKGLVEGLRFDHFTPNVTKCEDAIDNTIRAAKEVIQAHRENQTTYSFVNNLTMALGTVPKVTRFCMFTPDEVWNGIRNIFVVNFNSSIIAYSMAILKNILFNVDVVIYNYAQTVRNFDNGRFYPAGYSLGTLVNFVLNVTHSPPPPPPPTASQPSPSASWNGFFDTLKTFTLYTMTAFKYTKLVNETTFRNLNESVVAIEDKAHKMMLSFGENNTVEGRLLAIDMLEHANQLWNGLYFTNIQVNATLENNSVFQYPSYTKTNLILHSSYMIWSLREAVLDFTNGDFLGATRRLSIIARKALIFDEDTLEEIRSKTPLK
eukprot:TRINITY_DN2590_c0_g1_i16.p1 TRINITY_DN2590_c0_g1~~TRINITY_DN2590_c0_g1_i16.p1  ORF type:complete len:347 (+),score=52.37 TRINITY_DN2590_c0_g1_i16:166-1206(+)